MIAPRRAWQADRPPRLVAAGPLREISISRQPHSYAPAGRSGTPPWDCVLSVRRMLGEELAERLEGHERMRLHNGEVGEVAEHLEGLVL